MEEGKAEAESLSRSAEIFAGVWQTQVIIVGMRCPRCKSTQIQRGYDDAPIPLRLVGLHELLCNKCGLEFRGLDPFGSFKRAPSFKLEAPGNRRRAARYTGHLPATIHLAEKNPDTDKVSYSQPSRGHCESISKLGMTLSFVGTRFSEEELSRTGRLLFVTVDLPQGPVATVVSIVTSHRVGVEHGIGRWLVGVSICNISENDTNRLSTYLEKRAEGEPLFVDKR